LYDGDENDTTPTENDGWVTIERKVRHEFSEEERQARMEAREAEDKARQAQENSVWNTSNADDWDYRDRRVNN
jgi:hypothetical protein